MKVIAQQGDTLDLVCYRHYGQSDSGIFESVLSLNPHLANLGVTLPHGTAVELPDEVMVTEKKKMVQLWD